MSVDVYMMCGDDDAIRVHVIVPAPGLQERLAAEVKAATLSTQLFSLAAGGASSGAVLGRVLATRSLFMCDADAAVGGGVLDLGFFLCSTEDNSNNIARSAVMSNIVLLGIVGLAIVLFGVLLSLADPTHSDVLRTTAAIMLLPSSLLTVFGTIIPSSTTSAALLAARFGASACSALDAVLVTVAIVIVATPILTLLLLYRYALRNGKWECAERHEVPVPPRKSNSNHFMARVATVLREASRRRYQWRCCEGDDAMIKRSWAVLLEYRVLWYAAVDSSALVAVGVFSIAGGLSVVAGGETPSSCTPFAAIVIVLLCAQLLVVVAVRPYTTMFESIYVVATLTLSLVSVAGQLVFVVNTATPGGGQGSEWALMLSAICDLSTVGVSLMKSIMSGQTVALGIYRRVAHAVSLRKKSQHHERATKDDAANNDFTALNVGVVQEEDEEHHRGDRFLFLESEGETDVNNYLNREALYSDSRSDHSTPESQGDAQMIAEIENQFWDADGVARLGGGSDEHRNSSHEVVDRLHDGPHLQLW